MLKHFFLKGMCSPKRLYYAFVIFSVHWYRGSMRVEENQFNFFLKLILEKNLFSHTFNCDAIQVF